MPGPVPICHLESLEIIASANQVFLGTWTENYSGKMFSFSKDFPDKNSKLETLAEVEDDSQEKNERSFSKLKIIILDKQKPIVWVFFTSADMNCNSGPCHNAPRGMFCYSN